MTHSHPAAGDGGGLRHNAGKVERFDLIPPEFERALAEHFGQCEKKYPARNWERGMDWSHCYAALRRHLSKWSHGESFDNDPKLPDYHAHHLIAVAWNAMALYIYETRGIGNDDVRLKAEALTTTVVDMGPPVAGISWASPDPVEYTRARAERDGLITRHPGVR